jgi:hypothetical protein
VRKDVRGLAGAVGAVEDLAVEGNEIRVVEEGVRRVAVPLLALRLLLQLLLHARQVHGPANVLEVVRHAHGLAVALGDLRDEGRVAAKRPRLPAQAAKLLPRALQDGQRALPQLSRHEALEHRVARDELRKNRVLRPQRLG